MYRKPFRRRWIMIDDIYCYLLEVRALEVVGAYGALHSGAEIVYICCHPIITWCSTWWEGGQLASMAKKLQIFRSGGVRSAVYIRIYTPLISPSPFTNTRYYYEPHSIHAPRLYLPLPTYTLHTYDSRVPFALPLSLPSTPSPKQFPCTIKLSNLNHSTAVTRRP